MRVGRSISKLFARGKAVPWARIYFLGIWAYRKGKAVHGELTEDELRDLGGLLRKSRGRRRNLTDREFARLRTLVGKALEAARRA